jgi:hypothetical protein
MLLSYALREPESEEGRIDFERRVHGLARCLLESDAFLHAGRAGRHYLLGMLSLLGRIAPGHADPGGDVLDVPFAVPPRPRKRPAAAAVDPPLPRGARGLLWSSGVYPFLDGVRALRVFERAAAGDARLHFLVAGGASVGTHPRDVRCWEEFRAAAEASPLRDRIRLLPWIPYAERGGTWALADLALTCTRPGAEDEISWRNRALDALWGGVPQVLDGDDDLTAALVAGGAAVRTARTVEAGADAVAGILADPARLDSMARAARTLADGPLSWDAAVRPLAARILEGRTGGGLAPRPATPLRLEPRRWGGLLHRGKVSLRLRTARRKDGGRTE